jgi:hypothetical protein
LLAFGPSGWLRVVHMIVSPATLLVHSPSAGRAFVPVPPDATADQVGYAQLSDFSPVHLAQLDACTKCGRPMVANEGVRWGMAAPRGDPAAVPC